MGNPHEEAVVDQIRFVVQPILLSMGLELVDIEQRQGAGRALLRISIDKEQGVTIQDCGDASVYLGRALDVGDVMSTPYTLEVSSPGLDRPLKKREDYDRAMGKKVRIKLQNAISGQWVMVGRLADVLPDRIAFESSEGSRQEIPFENIRNARLEVEW